MRSGRRSFCWPCSFAGYCWTKRLGGNRCQGYCWECCPIARYCWRTGAGNHSTHFLLDPSPMITLLADEIERSRSWRCHLLCSDRACCLRRIPGRIPCPSCLCPRQQITAFYLCDAGDSHRSPSLRQVLNSERSERGFYGFNRESSFFGARGLQT
jgi:hypothetical protein